MEHKCAHCVKKKERTEKEYKDLINRLNRIEGQVRGVKNMVENDAYCMDIITQAYQNMRSRQHKRRQRRSSRRTNNNAKKINEIKKHNILLPCALKNLQ